MANVFRNRSPEFGRTVVIEGNDGLGKSTQVEKIAERLDSHGISSIQFHEPGGVEISQEIRDVIKNGDLARTALTNVLLFTASRRENWLQEGRTALQDGTWVLLARNHWSTDVYQGFGEGVPIWQIHLLTRALVGNDYYSPDHKFILNSFDEAARERRIAQRGVLENPDTFESRDQAFQTRVNDGYRKIAKRYRIPLINADQSIEQVHEDIWTPYIAPHVMRRETT